MTSSHRDRDAMLRAYAWNLAYARQLTADLSPDQWTFHAGKGLENHAAWTLGHLVTGSDLLAEDLGLMREVPESWRDLFERRGPGDPRLPTRDPSAYPEGEAILTALERQHDRVSRRWAGMTEEELAEPIAWRFGGHLPATRDLALFLAVTHEALHLGQLSAWRRALGLPSALGSMPRSPED